MNENENKEVVVTEQTTTTESGRVDALVTYQNRIAELEAKNKDLEAANNKMWNDVLGGEYKNTSEVEVFRDPKDIKRDIEEDIKKRNDLNLWKHTLELRESVMDRDNIDVFVCDGIKTKATQDDYDQAQQIADYVQHCIDYANGDNRLFVQEMSRNMLDNTAAVINSRVNKRR